MNDNNMNNNMYDGDILGKEVFQSLRRVDLREDH